MTEFEAEFEKVEAGGRAAPTRWLRSAGPPKQEKVLNQNKQAEEKKFAFKCILNNHLSYML